MLALHHFESNGIGSAHLVLLSGYKCAPAVWEDHLDATYLEKVLIMKDSLPHSAEKVYLIEFQFTLN